MNQQIDNALGGYEESVASGVIGITTHLLDLANKDIEVYKAELERMDATIAPTRKALSDIYFFCKQSEGNRALAMIMDKAEPHIRFNPEDKPEEKKPDWGGGALIVEELNVAHKTIAELVRALKDIAYCDEPKKLIIRAVEALANLPEEFES